jgi:hypothetical protein
MFAAPLTWMPHSIRRILQSARDGSVAMLGAGSLLLACANASDSKVNGAGGTTFGGTGSGGIPGSGGTAGVGGTIVEGTGGETASGGGVTSRGTTGAGGGVTNTGGAGSIATYSLRVDTPQSGATVSGVVTVSGLAPGFVNVEIWDPTHQSPPLAQVAPGRTEASRRR